MCMFFVAVGRSLTIVSYVAFKMAALLYLVTQMATNFTPFKAAIGDKTATCITFHFTGVTEMALLDMYSPIWSLL